MHKKLLFFGVARDIVGEVLPTICNMYHCSFSVNAIHDTLELTLDSVDSDPLSLEKAAHTCRSQFSEFYIDDTSLEALVVRQLIAQQKQLAVAESCTGGLIAKRITDQPGASAVFGYGFITYSNQAKIDLLGVSAKTLDAQGAVSPETAKEMAVGCRRRSHADIGLSVTGIAGPSGGTKEKPVGLVYIGMATEDAVVIRKLDPLAGCDTREQIRDRSACHAFDLVRRVLSPSIAF